MRELTPQLVHSLKSYSKEKLIKDLIAGIIVAIIALPLSIALALASGVSPVSYTHLDVYKRQHLHLRHGPLRQGGV